MGVALIVSRNNLDHNCLQNANDPMQMSLWTRTYTLDRLPGQQTATPTETDTKVDEDLEKGPLDSSESGTVTGDRLDREPRPAEVEEEIQKQGTVLDPTAPAGQPFADDAVKIRTKQ